MRDSDKKTIHTQKTTACRKTGRARGPDPAGTAGAEQGHWYSHFHARAIALRGLLQFGWAAGDARVLEFVRRAYEFTLTQGIPRLGWINCFPAAVNMMEGCALGDLIALGIRLSDAGLGDYWDDVDAVTRNQLVEQQFTRADRLEEIARYCGEPCACAADTTPGRCTTDDVFNRGIGLFAGFSQPSSLPNPWAMSCCTGNASQGLYYAWEGIVRESEEAGGRACAQVNLLLNRAARLVDVHSYLPYEGKVVIRSKGARQVAVRIPGWVSRPKLRAEVTPRLSAEAGGASPPGAFVGNYLVFDNLRPGDSLTLTFPVVETSASYTANAQTAAEQVYTCTFRGSTCLEVTPRDEAPTSSPIYEREHLRADTAPMKTGDRFVARRLIRHW